MHISVSSDQSLPSKEVRGKCIFRVTGAAGLIGSGRGGVKTRRGGPSQVEGRKREREREREGKVERKEREGKVKEREGRKRERERGKEK